MSEWPTSKTLGGQAGEWFAATFGLVAALGAIVAAIVILANTDLRSDSKRACDERGGIYMNEYKSSHWCTKDGLVVEVYR